MNDYLSKLKEDIFDKNKIKFGSTLSELYKIKNITSLDKGTQPFVVCDG